ncbi:hypothetical protein ACQP00_02865 [Dactylosporangium sp. CS-047395]|uniref:hypothetical protein n=1 Tax=Dactylosporangium sp. CS-047395 TaxID=3239936 RepID=UPI003D940482
MEWICGGVCLLAVLAVAGYAVRGRLDDRRFFRRSPDQPISAVCINCRGRGWVDRSRRTLDFDGEGFVDESAPQTQCEICGGTGRVER